MTLPQLHSLLLTKRLDALVAVPASFDPGTTEQHFFSAKRMGSGLLVYPNGSTVRIFRGSDAPRFSLAGLHLDIAMVLTPWPADTMREVRIRLLPRDGVLFAPFEPVAGPNVAKLAAAFSEAAKAFSAAKDIPE